MFFCWWRRVVKASPELMFNWNVTFSPDSRKLETTLQFLNVSTMIVGNVFRANTSATLARRVRFTNVLVCDQFVKRIYISRKTVPKHGKPLRI
ncbi:unnamed protein product, partial [Tenebrio molitor]